MTHLWFVVCVGANREGEERVSSGALTQNAKKARTKYQVVEMGQGCGG